jgi:hypothetical protein
VGRSARLEGIQKPAERENERSDKQDQDSGVRPVTGVAAPPVVKAEKEKETEEATDAAEGRELSDELLSGHGGRHGDTIAIADCVNGAQAVPECNGRRAATPLRFSAVVGWAKRSVPTSFFPPITWARRFAPLPTLQSLV